MTEDIAKRIEKDFAADSEIARHIMSELQRTSQIFSDRVIRCIIALSKGSLPDLERNIAFALIDWRDIVVWAEEYNYQYNEPFAD